MSIYRYYRLYSDIESSLYSIIEDYNVYVLSIISMLILLIAIIITDVSILLIYRYNDIIALIGNIEAIRYIDI